MLKINKLKTQRRKISAKEVNASLYIPYRYFYNESTVITKAKDLLSVIKVQGYQFETSDDADLESKKIILNNLFKGFATNYFEVYMHTVRRKHAAYPGGVFEDPFCNLIDEKWKDLHDKDYTFVNELYVTIIRKNSRLNKLITKVTKRFKDTEEAQNEDEDSVVLKEYATQLRELTDRVLNALSHYQPQLLSCVKTADGYYAQGLEFLSSIINCCEIQKVLTPNSDLSEYLTRGRLKFAWDYGEYQTMRGESKFFGMVSLKEYRNSTHSGILDSFLQLPFEFVMTQSFSFIDKMIAINKMQLQQRRLIQSEDVAITQIGEINEALDSTMSGSFAFGLHHLTVMVLAESRKQLDNNVSQTVVEFTNIGINAVRENLNMEAAFWAQLPANRELNIRKTIINTLNLAGLGSLHNYPPGQIKNNHWGDAVTVFNTTSGTPYFFSFHVRDVGHTMIVGPTGAGKTVLMNFLCAQAQKFRPRMFFFDKDRGAEIFIRAIGGNYTVLSASEDNFFNPLQLDPTPDNLNFLYDWLESLVVTNGEKLTAEERIIIKHTVDANFKLPKEQRRLGNLAPFFGIEKPGSIASRLSQWHSGGQRSKIFDNDFDRVDFSANSVFGFEMGELLKDKVSLVPVLTYLFHKIQTSLDGVPTMVVLDEAWALIDNEFFAPRIKNWLKVMRKLNAMVIFATQSIEDATKSSISDTLVQQTATQIFLPNLKATETYQSIFMLSDREFSLIKSTDPSSRYFLVKQDSNAVIARIDLSNMIDLIHVLSGRVDSVQLMYELFDKYGTRPKDWLVPFIEKMEQNRIAKLKQKEDVVE